MSKPQQEWEEEQERLAGQEAAKIGGDPGFSSKDPAEQSAMEAGGGESEGWELAEEDLIRHASHGDERSDTVILTQAARPEQETDRADAQYAEADQSPANG